VHGETGESGKQRVNTLSLDGKALESLLDTLDRQCGGAEGMRTHVRRRFRKRTLALRVQHGAGSSSTLRVVCRNISSTGLSVLHNSYLHPGARCATVLRHRERGPTVVFGRIVRCQHRGGVIHELGVKFDEPLEVTAYVTLDPRGDVFSLERVDPEQLDGCVVYLEESELDQRLVQHFLRGTRVRLRATSDPERAVVMAGEGCDLLMLTSRLSSGAGWEEVADTVRDSGCGAPVIVIRPARVGSDEHEDLDDGAQAWMAKPITQEHLLRALGEFLLHRPSLAGRVEDARAAGAQAPELASEFAVEIRRIGERLEQAIGSRDVDGCRALCEQLHGSAGHLGFGEIAGLASLAWEALASTGSVEEASTPLRAVSSACLRLDAA